MPLIRDTIDPTREREVTREEALDLERMGGLLDTSATRARTDDGLRAAAVRQVLDRQAGRAAVSAPSVPVAPSDEDEDVVDEQDDTESVGTDGDTADSVTETLVDQADTTEDDPEG